MHKSFVESGGDAQRALLTVAQLARRYPAFTQGSIRNLIFMSKPRWTSTGSVPGNGLAAALVRVGRKVLIDEAKFLVWLDSLQASEDGDRK